MANKSGPDTHYIVQNIEAARDIGLIGGNHRDPNPPKG
jgi:hypothetical protein